MSKNKRETFQTARHDDAEVPSDLLPEEDLTSVFESAFKAFGLDWIEPSREDLVAKDVEEIPVLVSNLFNLVGPDRLETSKMSSKKISDSSAGTQAPGESAAAQDALAKTARKRTRSSSPVKDSANGSAPQRAGLSAAASNESVRCDYGQETPGVILPEAAKTKSKKALTDKAASRRPKGSKKSNTEASSVLQPSLRIVCGSCDKQYSTEEDLRLHIGRFRERHAPTCDVCEKIFQDAVQLRNHYRYHKKTGQVAKTSRADLTKTSAAGNVQVGYHSEYPNLKQTIPGQPAVPLVSVASTGKPASSIREKPRKILVVKPAKPVEPTTATSTVISIDAPTAVKGLQTVAERPNKAKWNLSKKKPRVLAPQPPQTEATPRTDPSTPEDSAKTSESASNSAPRGAERDDADSPLLAKKKRKRDSSDKEGTQAADKIRPEDSKQSTVQDNARKAHNISTIVPSGSAEYGLHPVVQTYALIPTSQLKDPQPSQEKSGSVVVNQPAGRGRKRNSSIADISTDSAAGNATNNSPSSATAPTAPSFPHAPPVTHRPKRTKTTTKEAESRVVQLEIAQSYTDLPKEIRRVPLSALKERSKVLVAWEQLWFVASVKKVKKNGQFVVLYEGWIGR
ncbi:hypothetical protein DFJ73DRAFT_814522 [Zopfochytrium polystomum]|nr:hypothetical protein DFJ73DRAFT_814522 [Zopfochytrium polystomum]